MVLLRLRYRPIFRCMNVEQCLILTAVPFLCHQAYLELVGPNPVLKSGLEEEQMLLWERLVWGPREETIDRWEGTMDRSPNLSPGQPIYNNFTTFSTVYNGIVTLFLH